MNGRRYTRSPLPFASSLQSQLYEDVERQLALGHGIPSSQEPVSWLSAALAANGVPTISGHASSPRVALGHIMRVMGCAPAASSKPHVSSPSSSYRCALALHNGSSEPSKRAPLVVPDAHVDRVLFEGKRAVGVELASRQVLRARREVVLSTGALRTPLVLARSGIGHAKDLQRLGVAPVHVNEHVGFHLQDHLYLTLQVDTGLPCNGSSPDLFAFYDSLPSSSGLQGDEDLAVEIQFVTKCKKFLSYTIYLILLHSRTVGRVVARSRDPHDAPGVLFDPFAGSGEDAVQLMRHARDLYRVLWEARPQAWEPKFHPSFQSLFDDSKGFQWLAQNIALWQHPTGTARIGSVLDEQLRVLGVQGLRVADGSALPASAAGHPDAAIRALGRLAALRATNV